MMEDSTGCVGDTRAQASPSGKEGVDRGRRRQLKIVESCSCYGYAQVS